ncbi:hypothetical protein H9P43_004827 [Blastocladiella emersonii ATCC 22665]|nr:hypothetical protein H9P43_004827 [Blastocladiella emersonii ATCC 22665]
MDAQVNMDLDSIIAANKASRSAGAGSGSGSRSGRGRRGGNGGNSNANDAPKNSGRGGDRERDRPARGGNRDRDAPSSAPARSGPLTTGSTKISVANLDPNVTESDLELLFNRVGRVKRVQLFFDRNGRSQGTAQVVYASKPDAAAAIAQYNGVTLDGRAMRIELVVAASALDKTIVTAAAPAPRRGGGDRDRNNNNNRDRDSRPAPSAPKEGSGRRRTGRPGRSGKSADKPAKEAPKSATDLDSELMAYMSGAAAAGGDAMQTD